MYQALLEQAASAGAVMLSRALADARRSIREDTQRMRGTLERDNLELCVKMLDIHGPELAERYPRALSDVFNKNAADTSTLGVQATESLHLEQLELMDETQLQERVEMARALQYVLQKADAALTELNTYVCTLLGLDHVMHERNPLRPDCYLGALQNLMTGMSVPPWVRTLWLQHLSKSLGAALASAYEQWSIQLRDQGVRPAGFYVVRTVETAPVQRAAADDGRTGREVWSPQYRQTMLTLERLRGLMLNEHFEPTDNPKEAFARQFEREFERGAEAVNPPESHLLDSGFPATVPAAFEALQEMQQVDAVVQRMAQRPVFLTRLPGADTTPLSARDELMHKVRGMNQMLSLEVVALMVDNLVQDSRLLQPVRQVIAQLESALLRLVLVDPRFFSNREHPARRLLQGISDRGLAFGSTNDPGFDAFLMSLQRHVSALSSSLIDGPQPFEQVLDCLLHDWALATDQDAIASQVDNAVTALSLAEERNLLAARMTVELRAIPDMLAVPVDMTDFLCGPWAQVMASAQLADSTHLDDPGQYKQLVNMLLWSAQPELTRKDVGKLTQMVPKLLSRLREGLHLIDYPSVKTSAFFDVLMKLHQQAFKPASRVIQDRPASGLASTLLGNQDHWVAPAEAKASGFLAFPEDVGQDRSLPAIAPMSGVDDAKHATVDGVDDASGSAVQPLLLSVGVWVELQTKGAWQRTQLSWISPHRTMYLFTSVQGKTQSMTLRMLQRMLRQGLLRVVSDQASMVDGALDAVVQTAILNSMDIKS